MRGENINLDKPVENPVEGNVMDVSENTSKVSFIVAAFCILVYIAAIAFGATRIIVDMGDRRSLAEKEFHDLSDRASSSAVFLGFMSEAYQDSIRDFLNTSSILLGVIITGSNSDFAFERYPGSGIVWAGNSPRFKIGVDIPREPFFMPLRIDGQRNVTIQAIYSFLDHRFFQTVLRDTLFAVLAALLVASVVLLVEFRSKKKTVNNSAKNEDLSAVSPAAEAETMSVTERKPEKTVPDKAIKPDSESPGAPQGLYSPRSNIGWESYTYDRLAAELQRSSSFEQDLTFLVMEFRKPVPVYRQFADEAVSFFSMRDLIFEQGRNGISIILPNAGLEQAMAKSEEFRSRIAAKLPESFEGRTELCIGLTSRTGRLVEAKRLMLEAFSAKEKALKDEQSNIVAFRSDPDKYREFIKQKQP